MCYVRGQLSTSQNSGHKLNQWWGISTGKHYSFKSCVVRKHFWIFIVKYICIYYKKPPSYYPNLYICISSCSYSYFSLMGVTMLRKHPISFTRGYFLFSWIFFLMQETKQLSSSSPIYLDKRLPRCCFTCEINNKLPNGFFHLIIKLCIWRK